MPTLKEAAEAYETSELKNISDLKEVGTDLDLKSETKENTAGETYRVDYITIDDVKYRVPVTVRRDLKAVLERKPGLTKFCVNRTGTTKEDTRYTVIALD